MESNEFATEFRQKLRESLAYLNLSSGAADARFRHNLSDLTETIEASCGEESASWVVLRDAFAQELELQRGKSEALKTTEQAEWVLRMAFGEALTAYRDFHRDLLFHQPDHALFRPFFLARVCEASLQCLTAGTDPPSAAAIVEKLNTYLGHRPVAVLRTPERIEPYPHEWVCPIPLYFEGAGVAAGRYREIVALALEILSTTPQEILDDAHFDPKRLRELALDPRAYDFDHPANRRPSYHFGGWDPHKIDNHGYYSRFILQEITLEALLSRALETEGFRDGEIMFESAAVLTGAILMASGVSGRSPDAHDSSVSLSVLSPRIARYRDRFYEKLLDRLPAQHALRLRAEAAALHQPFGAARQYLNQQLARLRAKQLEHVQLAQLFARMGYPEASERQSRIVPVASARMLCEIKSHLTTGHACLDAGELFEGADRAAHTVDLLRRGIRCGALVDPWNILGFQGQYSVFAAIENSVRDHRVDVLTHVMDQIFDLYIRLASEAAAANQSELEVAMELQINELAVWWDQFATGEVSGVETVSGRDAAEAANAIARALGAWRQGGASAGDIGFWKKHVVLFKSPKAFGVVIDALLDRRDFVAAMALLVQWLGHAEETKLAEGEHSFFDLCTRWVSQLWATPEDAVEDDAKRRALSRRFFDLLEANAEEYWSVPRFELGGEARPKKKKEPEQDEGEAGENLFRAAYEDMTFRDSTAGGPDSEMLDWNAGATMQEFDHEALRLRRRLAFFCMLARSWRILAPRFVEGQMTSDDRDAFDEWRRKSRDVTRQLVELLGEIEAYSSPLPSPGQEALIEFDRRRSVKDSLLARGIAVATEMGAAARWLAVESNDAGCESEAAWERLGVDTLRRLRAGDVDAAQTSFTDLCVELGKQTTLYAPLTRGGTAAKIVAAQSVQQLIMEILKCLPRAGLLIEADQLLGLAHTMEQRRPHGEGVVSEFDRLFEVGYKALVDSLVLVADDWQTASQQQSATPDKHPDTPLVGCLQMLTEPLLKRWLLHSRGLRLSVMEKVSDAERWEEVVDFIRNYGKDIFEQRFMNVGNLRAIIRRGIDAYLTQLEENDPPEWRLFEDLDRKIPRTRAVENLAFILEAMIENHAEYKDFNNTTTQSDSGDRLYMLLDFLRVKSTYERFAWNIKPVVMAHDVLVGHGKGDAAALWRKTVVERTRETAEARLAQLSELIKRYGMRLPTISDRLEERFVRPLIVDQLRALVRLSMGHDDSIRSPEAFEAFEREIAELTRQPTGAGLDTPGWIIAIEQEIAREETTNGEFESEDAPIPQTPLTLKEVRRQLKIIAGGPTNASSGSAP